MAVAVNPVTCDGMVWIIGVVAFAGAVQLYAVHDPQNKTQKPQ